MAEFNFSLTDGNQDELSRIVKTLNWLMNNLDHSNIPRIFTEYCSIQSENGETVIDGPLIKMNAGTATLRLKIGKEGENFVFKLYNIAGDETISLDSNGNVVITGLVSMQNGSVIDWNVINAPEILDINGLPIKLTYIDQFGIYTGTLTAEQINAIEITTLNISGTLNCGDTLEIGQPTATGQCHINTAADAIRIQAHQTGNYLAQFDAGGLDVFVSDTNVASITPLGKFLSNGVEIGLKGDKGDPGEPGTSAISTDISYAVDGSGVTITKDGVAEIWTWTKDESGRITAMASDLNRSITVNY